jgi:hypothetical protein
MRAGFPNELAILRDARAAPRLFHWLGPIEEARLDDWLRRHDLAGSCLSDLVKLWRETGGGDFFESETILGPIGNAELGDDLIGANDFLHALGVPERFLVFCEGCFRGAVDVETGEYVQLVGTTERERFASLDEWYARTERAEFAERYGLPSP